MNRGLPPVAEAPAEHAMATIIFCDIPSLHLSVRTQCYPGLSSECPAQDYSCTASRIPSLNGSVEYSGSSAPASSSAEPSGTSGSTVAPRFPRTLDPWNRTLEMSSKSCDAELLKYIPRSARTNRERTMTLNLTKSGPRRQRAALSRELRVEAYTG